jgi:hypothetical protein
MTFKNKINLLIIIIFFILNGQNTIAQDLSAFEVIDNMSVGLTIAPSGKVGMAIADIDGNGWQDILNVRWKGPGYSRIYINNNGIFQDISEQCPLKQIEEEDEVSLTRTCIWVDYDNDGDKDLSVSREKSIHLFRNDNNVFTDVSEEMGFVEYIPAGFISEWQLSLAGWADFDLDGDLDCAISQMNNPSLYLFRNDGDFFTDIAAEVGLSDTPMPGDLTRISWTDFDLDGDPDIHSRTDFMRNDNGFFTLVTDSIGLTGLGQTTNREFFDYDNDGDLDFFKATGSAQAGNFDELWENRDGNFVNISNEVGFVSTQYIHRGLTIGDFDNDGDQDIFLENSDSDDSYDVLFVNDEVEPGIRGFANVSEFIGLTKTGDRKGCAFFDYDNDGFLDIYMPSAEFSHILYQNAAINNANWIGFILEGTLSNRDAVGSIVTLYIGEKKQIRLTKCGNGFVRQDNPWVHFGIGFETSVDSIVIRWPLGHKQVLADVAINQYHNVKEPDYSSVESKDLVGTKPTDFKLEQNYPNPFNPTTKVIYSLSVDTDVRLVIYDITGKQVITLVDHRQKAGRYSAAWDGRSAHGDLLPSGVYVYRIQAGGFIESKKMVFVQ